MSITSMHIYGLVITLLIVIAIGIYSARKVKTATDYTVGGHSSGVSLVAGSIIGTIIGGASTIGTAQLAFTVGLSAWWFTLGAGLALLVLAMLYARPLRASGLQTIPQYLVINYGQAAGPMSSITSSIGIFFSIVANLLAALPLLTATFGLDALQGSVVAFILTIVYVFGGVWGLGLVGIVKTFLIYITLLAAGVLTYQGMNGLDGFLANFTIDPWFNLFGRGVWVDVGSALALLVGTISTQTYIQAVYSARDVRAARQGAIVAAIMTIPIGIPAVMVGMFMRVHHPDIMPIYALPGFILTYLPHWFGGIAIAALLLAAIGSAAGLALGVGTMLSRDIFATVMKINERRMLWITRVTVLVVTLLAALFTLGNMKSLVLEWNYLSMGLRGAGIFLPLTAAVFCGGRIQGSWAIWSIVAGTIGTLAYKLAFPQGIDPLYAGLVVNFVFLAMGFRGKIEIKKLLKVTGSE